MRFATIDCGTTNSRVYVLDEQLRVVAVGTRSVDDLSRALRDLEIEVHVVGDAQRPRRIFDAVHEGYAVGCRV